MLLQTPLYVLTTFYFMYKTKGISTYVQLVSQYSCQLYLSLTVLLYALLFPVTYEVFVLLLLPSLCVL